MERRLQHILITGVTGFLGGHLAAQLTRAGLRVRGMGRDAEKGRILSERLGVEFVRDDPSDKRAVAEACQEVDTVFHVAALSSPWGKPENFVRANVDLTRKILTAARAAGVGRLVHVSTPSLYFRYGSGLLVREDAVLPPPVNEYVRTKRMAELLVQEVGREGLETVILRPRALIGAGDPSILPRLVRALEKGRLPVIGDGLNLTDLTCVENVAQAMVLAAVKPAARVAGKIYNITNGEPVALWPILARVAHELGIPQPRPRIPCGLAMKMARLLELAGRLTGREPSLTRYAVGVLATSQTLDISAARRDLDYMPEVPLEEGLRRFVAWWKAGAGYPFF